MPQKSSTKNRNNKSNSDAEPCLPFVELDSLFADIEAVKEKKPKPRKLNVVWMNPNRLVENSQNRELFGGDRLQNVEDLLESIGDFGFDPARSISAVAGENENYTIVDGHRRRRAAVRLGLPAVPVLICKIEGEDQLRREMILANIVRNKRFSNIGMATSVRLIRELMPRSVKRGRPSKAEIKFRREPNFRDEKKTNDPNEKHFAKLLEISPKMFKTLNYVVRKGTTEEIRDVDNGTHRPTTIQNLIRARLKKVESEENAAPPSSSVKLMQIVACARRCARQIERFLTLVESCSFTQREVDAKLKQLNALAAQEAAGKASGGATALETVGFLQRLTHSVCENA